MAPVGKRKTQPAAPPPDFRLERRRDLIALASLAALVLLFWWRVVLLRGFLFHDDMARQNLPWAAACSRALRHGSLPLWTTEMWCGFPLFAEGQVGALYPLNTLLLLILPSDVAVHYGLLLNYILAALFAFWLAREIGLARPAAALAGGLFALSGRLTVHAVHVNMARSMAWLPLLLLIVVKAGRSPRPMRLVPALGLAFAMQVLAGYPPALVMSTAAAALVALALPTLDGRWSLRAAGKMIILLAAGGALGAALAGVQLLPTLELGSLSARAEQRDPFEWVTWGQMPAQFAPTIAFPHLLGYAENRTFIGMSWQFHEWCAYVGLLPMALAAIGWRYMSRGLRRGLAILMVVGLTLALAKWPYHLLAHVPGANFFRLPTRWLLLFDIPVIIAGAAGFDALTRGDKKALKRAASLFGTVGAALALAAGIALAASAAGLHWNITAEVEERTRDLLAYSREPEPWFLAGALIISAAVLWAALRKGLSNKVAVAVVGALCILDLWRFGYNYNPLVPPRELRRQPPAVAALRRDGMKGRVFQPAFPTMPTWKGFRNRSWAHVRERIALLMPNENVRWGIPDLAGYTPLEIQQNLAIRYAFVHAMWKKSDRLLQITNTAYKIERAPGYTSKASGAWPAVRISRVRDPVPRAYLVGAVVPAAGVYEAMAIALSGSFDPHAAVAVEGISGPPPRAAKRLAGASARIVRESATRVEVECRAPRPAILVLADMFYPGWVAVVDGQVTPIFRANGVFRAVPVDRGRHRVVFAYRPASFRAGIALSAFSLLTLAIVALLMYRKRED